jgi:hypothetical protein
MQRHSFTFGARLMNLWIVLLVQNLNLFICDIGEKKKHKKELIAKKRRQRMLSRGVDLQQIDTVSHIIGFAST